MKQSHIKSSLKLNVIFNSIYQVFMLIVPLLTAPYISRVLLEGQIGSYSYSNSLVYYFTMFAAFGFLDYGTMVIAKVRHNKESCSTLFYELFYCKAILTIVSLILYYILVGCNAFFSSNYPESTTLVYAIFGLNIFSTMFDMTFFFQGMENFLTICIRNFIVKILNVICIFVFVKNPSDFLSYVLIMTISTFFSALITFFTALKYAGRPQFKHLYIWSHFTKSFFYFIPLICFAVITYFPKTCLGIVDSNPINSAYFEQADRVIGIIVSAISSVNSVLLSRMSYLYATKNEEEIKKKIYQTLELYLLLAIPAFWGILAINSYFTPGFFGESYRQSIPLICLMAPRILFSPLYAILGAIYYIPQGKTFLRNLFYILSCLINIVLCLILTFFLSVQGTALAYMLSEVITAFVFIFFARNHIFFTYLKSSFIKIFDASLIMFLLCLLIEHLLTNTFSSIIVALFAILCGAFFYGVLLLVFREEMACQIARGFLKKIKQKWRKTQ